MLLDDLIYVGLLLLCIGFGKFYRSVESVQQRQWVGTIVGLGLVTLVSGVHVFHPVLCTLVNAVIITQLSPKVCHLVSFTFSFFYLLVVFRMAEWFGLSMPPNHANLVQMMLTLKLAGLGSEVNNASSVRAADDPEGASSAALARLSPLDVFHYAFSYIGVLTGPYYRYRTYWDSLHRPFAAKVDHWAHTSRKLKLISLYTVCFLLSNYIFPAKYVLTDDFAYRSFLYRFGYIYPTFVTFRMRMYIGMLLSECVCQMAGLGAYPTKCHPITGLGPKDYKGAVALSNDAGSIKSYELDFETVHNINVWEVEKCILVRDAMKKWNTCVQYWMAVYVYKRFPHRGLRTAATLTLSALWHGFAPGYYLCICQITFFLPMEDIYAKFYRSCSHDSLVKLPLHCLLWFLRITCMSYLGLSFQLLQFHETLSFYWSIWFFGHFLVFGLYVIGQLVRPYVIATDGKKHS